MTTPKFADTHNLVAFLEKPTESAGFEEIVDFLNANPIKYALTINPTIYTSCIEQFWATAKEKTINGEVQLQALVDGKKVIITESTIRRDLHLEDAEGTDCLHNATIFEELTRMRYEKLSQKLTFYKAFFSPQWKFLIHTILQCLSAKTTTWNKFSSIMASAIIFLATNKMFNFSKCIFESMVRNVENVFLMYSRFVQVFVNQQVGNMSHHKRIFVTPSHTKKIFGNMKREGKGFSGRVTPLFPTMMVQAHEEIGKGSANPTDPHHTPIITQPSSSQPQKKQKPKNPRKKDTKIPQSSGPTEPIADEAANEENVPTHSNDPLLSGKDRLKLEELMALYTNLQNRVLDLEHTKTTQTLEIESLKRRVKKLKKNQRLRTHKLKRLYKVGLSAKVVSSEDKGLGEEDASKQGRKIQDIDADKDITLDSTHFDTDTDMFGVHDLDGDEVFEETKEPVVNATTTTSTIPVSAVKDLSDVDMTLAQALAELRNTKPKAITTAVTTTTTAVIRPKAKGLIIQEQEEASTPINSLKDKGKGIMVEEPLKMKKKDQDKVETDYELAQRLQAEEQEELTVEENEVRAEGSEIIAQESSFKRAGYELEQEKTKKQKIDDDQEEAEIKKLMEIIPDEEEVAVDAIPLATKPPSIVDWKIVKEGNMSLFQIIRANRSAKRYSSFIQMLRDFNREDLETLWKLVKAKHGYTRPEEGYERVLWGDLKTMFEPDVEDMVWISLQENKVLIWKLFDSRGVHFVRFQSIHIFMLVEKKYPLTPATITAMLNRKLQADYWNEMCYQLLKLMTK
ncbi:hypothetical protein Tco_1065456 [Tanacetum coccineum]